MRRALSSEPEEPPAVGHKRPRATIDLPSTAIDKSTDGPISSLLLDALRLILSYLPRFARLRFASLVCKRWRYAALATIAELTMISDRGLRALPLLPRLHDLSVKYPPPSALTLPSTLTKLSLEWPISFEGIDGCSALPCLSTLIVTSSVHPPCIVRLIQASRTRLSSLHLEPSSVHSEELSMLLEVVDLPALSDLSIDCANAGPHAPALASFVRHHVRRLSSLSLLSSSRLDVLIGVQFAALRSLSVKIYSDLGQELPAVLGALISNGPLLSSLTLEMSLPHELAQLVPYISVVGSLHLVLDGPVIDGASSNIAASLRELHRSLRSLRLANSLLPAASEAGVSALVTHISMTFTGLPFFSDFSGLTSISFVDPRSYLPQEVHKLPYLAIVQIRTLNSDQTTADFIYRFVESLFKITVAVGRLEFALPALEPADVLRLKRLIGDLEKRGVCSLEITVEETDLSHFITLSKTMEIVVRSVWSQNPRSRRRPPRRFFDEPTLL